jgi:hypothetical protein
MIKTSTTAITDQGVLRPVATAPQPIQPRVLKSDWEMLTQTVSDGMEGRNASIPMGFPRLNNHIAIRGSLYFLLGGYTGSGKTSFLDDAFVLNPVDWLMANPQSQLKLHVNYWSMERKRLFKLGKWVTRRIFLDTGVVIPLGKLFGWYGRDKALTMDEKNLLDQYKDYTEAILDYVTLFDGPQNPMAVKKYVDEYAKARGKLEKPDQWTEVYIPDDPYTVTINVYDHIGKWKRETRTIGTQKHTYNSKKELIDLNSEDSQRFRDVYGHSIVAVSQFNRDIANPMRIKNGDVEPQMEDFKDSGNTQEDADVVISLFDVMRYPQIDDPIGYNLNALRNQQTGAKMYRSLRINKNSFGSDDIRVGLAFQPVIGHFAELPKVQEVTDSDYAAVIDNSFFKQ